MLLNVIFIVFILIALFAIVVIVVVVVVVVVVVGIATVKFVHYWGYSVANTTPVHSAVMHIVSIRYEFVYQST